MDDIEKLLEIAKDLLEIFVLALTAQQLLKVKKKERSNKSKKRRK